jgi:hypothetical protein
MHSDEKIIADAKKYGYELGLMHATALNLSEPNPQRRRAIIDVMLENVSMLKNEHTMATSNVVYSMIELFSSITKMHSPTTLQYTVVANKPKKRAEMNALKTMENMAKRQKM